MKITDLYESDFLTNKDDIIDWIKKSFAGFSEKQLDIQDTGLYYYGHLEIRDYVSEIKVQFNSVSGKFYASQCEITKLTGCPQIVDGDFSCADTKINTLKECPKIVGRTFFCQNVKIADTKEYRFGLYSEIGEKFYSGINEIDKIINTYGGAANRKHWPAAINLLGKVKL